MSVIANYANNDPKLDVPSGELRVWLFVEGNPVNDGFVFWIRAVAYDLAVKILSDTSAGGVLYGHRIDETPCAESCVSPLDKCGHDFPAKTLPVGAFLEPKAEFGRNRIRAFQRGHAEALPVVEPPDDERKLVRFRSLHSLLASHHVLAPRWRLPCHEFGDGGRDASENLLCIHHLELAELQSWGLDDNHGVGLSTTDNTRIDSWRKQAITLKSIVIFDNRAVSASYTPTTDRTAIVSFNDPISERTKNLHSLERRGAAPHLRARTAPKALDKKRRAEREPLHHYKLFCNLLANKDLPKDMLPTICGTLD